jgi:mono/diheme cytochrome c family protein
MPLFLLVCCVWIVCGCSGSPDAQPAAAAEPAVTTPVAAAPAVTTIDVPEFAISEAPDDIAKGLELFAQKGCTACHKVGGGKLVGPDLKGVTTRRDERWLKKMILRPDLMIQQDETAKKMFVEHLVPMPNQGVDPTKELPLLLAYLKSQI